MASNVVQIVIAGEGGQGVQSVANILSEAAYHKGKQVLYIPNFGVEQRGGVSVAFLQISDEPISTMKFRKADIVIALSGRAVARTKQYSDERTTYVYDTSVDAKPEDFPTVYKKLMALPAMEIVKTEFHPRVLNIFVMGAVIGATHVVDVDAAKEALEGKLGVKFEKDPALRDLNFGALERGLHAVNA